MTETLCHHLLYQDISIGNKMYNYIAAYNNDTKQIICPLQLDAFAIVLIPCFP